MPDTVRLTVLLALLTATAAMPPPRSLAALAASAPPALRRRGRALTLHAEAAERNSEGASAADKLARTDALLAEGQSFNHYFLEWLATKGGSRARLGSLMRQQQQIEALRSRIGVLRALANSSLPAPADYLRASDDSFSALRPVFSEEGRPEAARRPAADVEDWQ